MVDYYNDSNTPSTGASLSSATIRAEFDLISAGFVKVAPYTGHGGEIVAINAGGTAQESLTTTGTGNAVRATSPTLITPVLGTPTSGVLTNCTASFGGAVSGTTFTGTGTIKSTKSSGTTTSSAIVGSNLGGGSETTGVYGTASCAGGTPYAIHGVTANGGSPIAYAVYADNSACGGAGVYGISGTGTGVYGVCAGANNTDVGVYGSSTKGYGVVAASDTTSPVTAAFRIVPQNAQPTTGQQGDLYVTTAGKLVICTVAGTPGTWATVGTQT